MFHGGVTYLQFHINNGIQRCTESVSFQVVSTLALVFLSLCLVLMPGCMDGPRPMTQNHITQRCTFVCWQPICNITAWVVKSFQPHIKLQTFWTPIVSPKAAKNRQTIHSKNTILLMGKRLQLISKEMNQAINQLSGKEQWCDVDTSTIMYHFHWTLRSKLLTVNISDVSQYDGNVRNADVKTLSYTAVRHPRMNFYASHSHKTMQL